MDPTCPPSWIDRKRFSDEEPERAGGEYPLIRMTSFGERRRSDMRIVNRAMPRNGACPIGARVKWGKGQRPFRIFRKVRKNFTIIFYDAPGTPLAVKPAAPCADVAALPFSAALPRRGVCSKKESIIIGKNSETSVLL